MRRLILLLTAIVLPLAVQAEVRSYVATVTHVSDGDTVWVKPPWGGPPIQVRVQGIDAPEVCQPFGPQARQALQRRLLHRPVRVTERGRDDYSRTLARLQVQGQDVGGWLVSEGLAWSYRYGRNPGPYQSLQSQARQARRGLWSQQAPVEPRTFRKVHGPCAAPAGRL